MGTKTEARFRSPWKAIVKIIRKSQIKFSFSPSSLIDQAIFALTAKFPLPAYLIRPKPLPMLSALRAQWCIALRKCAPESTIPNSKMDRTKSELNSNNLFCSESEKKRNIQNDFPFPVYRGIHVTLLLKFGLAQHNGGINFISDAREKVQNHFHFGLFDLARQQTECRTHSIQIIHIYYTCNF